MATDKGKILIIDDEQPIRDYLSCVLENAGYEVCQAENGREGMKILDEKSVDLLITDLVMPEREGLETISGLAAQRPELKIIAMSGAVSSTAYLKIANSLGAQATIEKPFSRQEALAVVQSVMES